MRDLPAEVQRHHALRRQIASLERERDDRIRAAAAQIRAAHNQAVAPLVEEADTLRTTIIDHIRQKHQPEGAQQ